MLCSVTEDTKTGDRCRDIVVGGTGHRVDAAAALGDGRATREGALTQTLVSLRINAYSLGVRHLAAEALLAACLLETPHGVQEQHVMT